MLNEEALKGPLKERGRNPTVSWKENNTLLLKNRIFKKPAVRQRFKKKCREKEKLKAAFNHLRFVRKDISQQQVGEILGRRNGNDRCLVGKKSSAFKSSRDPGWEGRKGGL